MAMMIIQVKERRKKGGNMKKIILIPDSFKGTMDSIEICEIMRKPILKYYPDVDIVSIPVADGGEGSVECFLQALGGKKVVAKVKNPLYEDMQSFYGLIDNGKTAVIEMAACSGLPLIENRKNPMKATTYGVGELILESARNGAKKIIVGLGGSATNDGGCGAACAVGVRFYNSKGESFIPTGGTLQDISRIDMSQKDSILENVEIIAMCDINNPMHGPDGAARVFGPQKGATPELVEALDKGVKHLSEIIKRELNMDLANVPGTGAAGAMGAGMLAFFGAKLQMGIETVLDAVRFDNELQGTDMVFTGEGRIDIQSLRGKVVIGVARRAKKANVPVIAVVGDIGDSIEPAYSEGVSSIISINRVADDFSKVRSRAKADMALTIDNFMRFCKRMGL